MTTKEKVLELLAGAGGSISGEALASECNVSRAAIWKAVNALRQDGYEIEGTTNGGYILQDNDVFTAEIFQKNLAASFPEFSDIHTECFKQIDSTNTYAKRVIAECGNLRSGDGSLTEAGQKYHRAVFVAESQTAGRGRLGRTFVSPEKSGIYISLIYAPEGGVTNPAGLTACTAVAVCRALTALYGNAGLEPKVKWINDIFAGGKKLCGILAEGVANFESGMIESAVVGIGIDVRRNTALDEELSKVVGSLEEAVGDMNSNRARIAAEVAGQVLKIFEENKTEAGHAAIMEEYRAASFLIGQELTVYPLIGDDKSSYKAKAVAIDDNAGLVVELADGSKKTLSSGEVSLKSSSVLR